MTRAAVSLNDGEVTITLEEDNRVSLDDLRAAIRDQGFTPREADVRARGVAERRGAALTFRMPGSSFALLGSEEALRTLEERSGVAVTIRGRVEEGDSDRLRVSGVGDGVVLDVAPPPN